MPFWWRRRRKPWYTTWRNRRFRRRRRRPYQRRRRRYRRPVRRRRRRRRRYKVRRKLKKITIKQWQPDRIVKCKIRGFGYLVAGADGNQYHCYTNTKHEYTQPKAPGGGGFGCELFSLQYLYKEWTAHRNIWTKTNDYTDLVRYLGCRFTFFRHPEQDFIIAYDRQPPFDFTKDTYPDTHPLPMLLRKHKRVVKSIRYNPLGKKTVTLKIGPPKQMLTKWFFQKDFGPVNLLKLQGTVCNFGQSLYGPNTQSPCITIHALNTNFYKQHNWMDTSKQKYLPYPDFPITKRVIFYNGDKQTAEINAGAPSFTYAVSVARTTGFFQPGILQATNVQCNGTTHERPVTLGRYNPEEDTGVGNRVWLASTFNSKGWQPPGQQDILLGERPLFELLYGIWDYIKAKYHQDYLISHMIVVKCDAIKLLTKTTQDIWPLLDLSFIQGKMPYDETPTTQDYSQWVPSMYKQQQVLNDIVESGPLIPKLTNLSNSTWNLPYMYTFYFKWGGEQLTETLIQDPEDQHKYNVPDTMFKTVQIIDPLKQEAQAMLRSWDFRRGFITTTALKRMRENLSTDESFQFDETEPQKKKKKITSEMQCHNQEEEDLQACLLSLCEKDTFPEEKKDLQQLIHQQYQQQQQLKRNIFKILIHLKKKQRALQVQTGLV